MPSSALALLRSFLASPAAVAAFATARADHPALREITSPVGVVRALRDRSSLDDDRDALVQAVVQLARQSRAGADLAIAVLAAALARYLRRVLRRWGHDREDAEQELVLAILECLRADDGCPGPTFRVLGARVAKQLARQRRACGRSLSSPEPLDDDQLATTVPLARAALARTWAIATATLAPVDLHIVGAHLGRGDTFDDIGARLALASETCRHRFRGARHRLKAALAHAPVSVSLRPSVWCSDLLDGQHRLHIASGGARPGVL